MKIKKGPPQATENLLEDTDGVLRPPLPLLISRGIYADARYIDAVIVSVTPARAQALVAPFRAVADKANLDTDEHEHPGAHMVRARPHAPALHLRIDPPSLPQGDCISTVYPIEL